MTPDNMMLAMMFGGTVIILVAVLRIWLSLKDSKRKTKDDFGY
ncbi:MAG: hypothetical protein R2680_08180 [Nitrososphaeraceae archaeon]